MEQIFIRILNMSLTSGITILAVILARLFLHRAPKIFSYVLWSAVLFRLLCPFSFSSAFSLLGLLNAPVPYQGQIAYIPGNIGLMEQPRANLPGQALTDIINSALPAGVPERSTNPMQLMLFAGTILWLSGIIFMLISGIVAYGKLQRILKDAVPKEAGVYCSSRITTPFVCGIFRPRIYLPCLSGQKEENFILMHEKIHIRRGDHILRLVSYFALCLHWFNPLVWIAFSLSGKDMEMSCDEAVIKKLGNEVKKEYSVSLLAFACGRASLWGIPPAFGEGDTKRRIQNLFHYKRMGKIAAAAIAAACILATAFLAFNPENRPQNILYSCYNIPIGEGNLRWGMSSEEVVAAIGAPSQTEHQKYADVFTYDIPLSGSLGSCSQAVLYIGTENLWDNGQLSSGLAAIAMTMDDTDKDAMLGKLADFYGTLSPEGGSTPIELQLQNANPDYFYQYHFCDEWKIGTLPEESRNHFIEIYPSLTRGVPSIIDENSPLLYINLWGVDHYSCIIQLNASVLACYLKMQENTGV